MSKDSQVSKDLELSSLRIITRGASLFVVGKIVLNVLEFLLNLVLTRTLGASLYGVYAYTTTVIAASMVFTNLGSENSILKYLPQYEDNPRKQNFILGLAFLTSLAGSLIVAFLLYQLAPFITGLTLDEPLLTDVLRLFAVLLVFDTLAKVVNSTFRALELLEFQILVHNIVRPTLRLIGVGAALLVGLSFIGIMASFVVASTLVFLFAVSILISRVPVKPSVRTSDSPLSDAKHYYNFSLPLTIKDTGALLRNRVDILMVGLFLSSVAVGIYNIAVLIAGLLIIPLVAFNQLFPPVASRLYTNDRMNELNSIYGIVTRWTFTISLLMAVGTIVYRKEILALFGDEFVAGSTVLVLFVAGQLVNNAVGPSAYVLMMTEHQYVLLINQWVFGVLNVVLNYFFILEFGLIGAALATASVIGVLNVVRLIEVWYFERLFPYSLEYFKPLLAGCGAALTMYGVSFYFSGVPLIFVGGGLGVITHLTILLSLGLEDDDKEFFKTIVLTRF